MSRDSALIERAVQRPISAVLCVYQHSYNLQKVTKEVYTLPCQYPHVWHTQRQPIYWQAARTRCGRGLDVIHTLSVEATDLMIPILLHECATVLYYYVLNVFQVQCCLVWCLLYLFEVHCLQFSLDSSASEEGFSPP